MKSWLLATMGLAACTAQEPLEQRGPISADRVDPAAFVLYDAMDQSVHEMVTCGGAQRDLVTPLALRVITAADGLLEPAARDELLSIGRDLGIAVDGGGFVQRGADWQIPMPGGEFTVRFLDGDTPITADPFVLDSYVRGAVADSSMTWDELLQDVEAPATFRFYWEEEGELAPLLQPLTNPIVVEASLWGLVLAAFGDITAADLGSFAGLSDIGVVGHAPFSQAQGAIDVSYDARVEGDVGSLASFGVAAIQLDELSAQHESWTIDAVSIDIEDVALGLAGEIVFAVEGPDASYEVTADFGEGQAYPESHWVCVRGCPAPMSEG